ncbi:MAG TPA: DUF169 domain-containing protein [Vicinamibacterales bacterium]
MPDYAHIEQLLTGALGLRRRPIAVAFRETVPPGVAAFTGSLPSGCSFWKLAAEGRSFYTVPGDHFNCPIGSYTHNIPLPPDREPELRQTLAWMTEIGYLRMDEVPGIPRLPVTPGVIVYAPLADTPVEPDTVMVVGEPGRLMLLHEAATRSGIAVQPLFGRPTCMAIPASLTDAVVSSMGCVGNRMYTGLSDSELYASVSGKQLGAVAEQLVTIVAANVVLSTYYEQRRIALTT